MWACLTTADAYADAVLLFFRLVQTPSPPRPSKIGNWPPTLRVPLPVSSVWLVIGRRSFDGKSWSLLSTDDPFAYPPWPWHSSFQSPEWAASHPSRLHVGWPGHHSAVSKAWQVEARGWKENRAWKILISPPSTEYRVDLAARHVHVRSQPLQCVRPVYLLQHHFWNNNLLFLIRPSTRQNGQPPSVHQPFIPSLACPLPGAEDRP